jgi:hypothetical protein
MKSRMFAIVAIVTASLSAYAGKEERDVMQNDTQPAIAKAQAQFKSACGCGLSITVDETTIKSKDDLHQAMNIANDIADGAPKYCTDAPSKKAMCQMRSLTIAKTKEAIFSFKGGKGLATTDGNSSCSWEMITRELDK